MDGSGASEPILTAAPARQLPPVPADLFTRAAAAVVALRAARGGATSDEIEGIVARGAAQAARVLATEHP
jgi:hypothetical protein